MAFLFVGKKEEAGAWRQALESLRPDLAFFVWPEVADLSSVRYALVWGDPGDTLSRIPRLNAIFSLGAGVDHILASPRPETVPVVRLLDAGMGDQMAEYVLHWALHFQRDFDRYQEDQRKHKWAPRAYRENGSFRCGILGLGVLGGRVADALLARGYPVLGWGRSPRQLAGVLYNWGQDQLERFLEQSELLISLLPMSESTRGFLNGDIFDLLPAQAVVMNLGRGGVLDDGALLRALDDGKLRAAVLDVFASEPPTTDAPLWRHPRIYMTPHIAAKTLIAPSAEQICSAIRTLEKGERPAGQISVGMD